MAVTCVLVAFCLAAATAAAYHHHCRYTLQLFLFISSTFCVVSDQTVTSLPVPLPLLGPLSSTALFQTSSFFIALCRLLSCRVEVLTEKSQQTSSVVLTAVQFRTSGKLQLL